MSTDLMVLARLTPIVYNELHRLAGRYMRREQAGHTLQTTALLNEAYLRLVDSSRVRWQNRAHFYAVAAQLMRRILVDFARHPGNAVAIGTASCCRKEFQSGRMWTSRP